MPPDFLCIGAQKSGTTWLHRAFERHPDIWMPPEKELHYWDEKRDNAVGLVTRIRGSGNQEQRWRRQVRHQWQRLRGDGPRDLATIRWQLRYLLGTPGDSWYQALFRGGDKVSGEITPNYSMLRRLKVAPVHELLPDLKIIFLIRNPVERAWSHASMHCGGMWRGPRPATEDDYVAHFQSPTSRRLSDYVTTIDTWTEFYPPDRFFLGFIEDLHFRPAELLAAIYGFLGVDPTQIQKARAVVNARGTGAMPASMAVRLAELYLPQIRVLDERYGGHAARWRRVTERILETPPESETVAYPLWDDVRWADEGDPVPPEFASGVLSTLTTEETR